GKNIEQLIVINRDISYFVFGDSQLGWIITLAHELAHSQQSLRSDTQYREPFFRVLIEGFQRYREQEILEDHAGRQDAFGGYVRQLIDQQYELEFRMHQPIRGYSIPAGESVTYENKLAFLLSEEANIIG